ncbi:hypothetical protein Hdeb2414_s0001g00034531 [Helianthus debilis subsp. tardiflorus]
MISFFYRPESIKQPAIVQRPFSDGNDGGDGDEFNKKPPSRRLSIVC